jgi:hypothetical protein
MSTRTFSGVAAALVVMGGAALAATLSAAARPGPRPTVFASGLNNPRGMAFGPDGTLYVAEGGTGGDMATAGDSTVNTPQSETPPCRQVPGEPGPGPVTGGFTSQITQIDRHGRRSVLVGGLPSNQTTAGGLVSGVADLAFLGGRMYAIEAAAGCSHGLAGTHNSLLRVSPGGKTTEVVDLSAYLMAHPILDDTYEQVDFEPDGTWYSMVPVGGALYAVEPNHQEIDRITPRGDVTRVLDMSQESRAAKPKPHWIGPTSISAHDGDLYFGALGPFPVDPGTDAVWKLTPGGDVSPYTTGLTAVVATAWDDEGRLYALESMTASGAPGPGEVGTGKVVRIDPDQTQTTVVKGLTFPTEMIFGPDGALYISNLGFGGKPGDGQILRVTVPR